jgi:hypothetical protein
MRPSRSGLRAALFSIALGACARAPGSPGAPPSERSVAVAAEDGSTLHATERLVDGAWVRDGASRRVSARGVALEAGSYLLGEREGVWIFRAPDGALDAERTGVYESGERIAPWYEEGTRSGRLKSGTTQLATYAHGLRNGPAHGFHPGGGRESEGGYADGLRTGPWTYWLESGAVDVERSGLYRLDVKVADLDAGDARGDGR